MQPLISIVDDDPSICEALSRLVRSAGWEAECFTSAEHFLLSNHLGLTRCLILDMQMPGGTGLELQQKLRKKGMHIPAVIITGNPDEKTEARAMALGALGYLEKPFDDEDLLHLIEKGLQKNGH